MMPEAFVRDKVRTPMGRYAGALASVRADDLAALPLTALVQRNRGAGRYALCTMCVGVGQGIALILERV